MEFYAHTKDGAPFSEWQTVEEHLLGVAAKAERFAAPFHAGDWAFLAGLWHDLGKYSEAFQTYLNTASSPDPHVAETATKTDHSTAGAKHAVQSLQILGHLLGYAIAGHHAGLLNGIDVRSCQKARLEKDVNWSVPESVEFDTRTPALPDFLQSAFSRKDGFSIAFFARMVFSCLVDADFLDTEAFMSAERSRERPAWPGDVLYRMSRALAMFIKDFGPPKRPVDRHRAAVHLSCLESATRKPGLFSLTVPTGGGKTLASLAFALNHAVTHGLRRVIYVVPFTTIIEQNADVFRDVMDEVSRQVGQDVVIEHHCNVDTEENETATSRLATQNWDAPLIVTTSVQFYESLFGNRTSRCRKLHRVAGSVIILDEAQALPVDFLHPCLRALRELVENYGSSVVLCTATQPAVHHREGFDIGLKGVSEIIPSPVELYESLKRVVIKELGELSDVGLAERVRAHERVLCVVNTRGHAFDLYGLLGEHTSHFHLSALMCPAHRSQMISTIRERLDAGRPCRVVSTQLIEAGVDIDFPTVFRSLAGLDSIAQAAGRCNRNGEVAGGGMTYVFRPAERQSEKYFAETANCASQVLDLHDDPLSLVAIEHYFSQYYWEQTSRWDNMGILDEFHLDGADADFPFNFGFARVARAFRLIQDTGRAIIVPWGDRGQELCERLRSAWPLPDRKLLRQLQRFTVQVPHYVFDKHKDSCIELIHDRYPVLICPETHYSEDTGLHLREEQPVFLEA